MTLSLTQSLTDPQTLFALFMYIAAIAISLPLFETIHEKLEHHFPQYLWDKIGMPVLRTLLLLLFLAMVFPLNFGLAEAPALSAIIQADKTRFDFLFNMLFLVTFIYPVIPIIGKADAFMIPLQGIVASMLLFRWLCQSTGLENYSVIPGMNSLVTIIIITIVGYVVARYLANVIGLWLDQTFHRDGYPILVFQGVVMLMQSPTIFIYGQALGQQIIR